MPSIDSIAERYVERAAALSPFYSTYLGIAGHDEELADLSADGFAERAEPDGSTRAALAAEASELREQVAQAAMQEQLALEVERYDAGDTTSELNVIASWVQWVRQLLDVMPTEGGEAGSTSPSAWPRCRRPTAGSLRPCSARPGTAGLRPGCRSRRSPSSARPGRSRGTPSTQDW
jgi:hypothetical protein